MNPLLGVCYHWMGGFASASFYVPYRSIRRWSWEIFWLVGGMFSWIIAPWFFASLRTSALLNVLQSTPQSVLGWVYFWGVMWGLGGLTFGLTMRYLGLSLGMAVALGITMVIGTLGPPIFHGTFVTLASTPGGRVTFAGIALALIGIIVVAKAGSAKQAELDRGTANPGVAEFDVKKGILIAIFSGVLSGCFAWGLDAGQPIRELTLAAGTSPLNQGLPVLCVVLLGGFTSNFVWCAYLIRRNRSVTELIGKTSAAMAGRPLTSLRNSYLLAALGGTLWYFQFFFYTMGESQMGRYSFSSWTLHMASIILFSTLWGFGLKEWSGTSHRTKRFVWMGLALLISSTIVIGIGNSLAQSRSLIR
jgi:L-rhamnose-H+ transport protein